MRELRIILVRYRLLEIKKNLAPALTRVSALNDWRNQGAKLLSGRFYRPAG